jgi:hypothetical protein
VKLGAMLPLLAAVALAGPPKTHGDVEGYHSPDNRVACVMVLHYDAAGNAVRCGRKGSGKGLLLPSDGPAKAAKWRWPDAHKLFSFTLAPPGRTLYLVGGTAKIKGNARELRCTFTGAGHVRCLNGQGHGLDVTKRAVKRV